MRLNGAGAVKGSRMGHERRMCEGGIAWWVAVRLLGLARREGERAQKAAMSKAEA